MSMIMALNNYINSRFNFSILLILPLIMTFFSIEKLSITLVSTFIYSILFIICFRFFDDFMCINYDKKNKEDREYYHHPLFFKVVLSFLALLLIPTTFYLRGYDGSFYLCALILTSSILYLFFRNSKFILFISLLKYPILISINSLYNTEKTIVWPIIIFLLFILKELIDEKFISLSQKPLYLILLVIVSIKTYQIFN